MTANTASPRRCIKCGQDLRPLDIQGVEIDHCGSCGGIWLDEGEIRALAARPGETMADVAALEARIAAFSSTDPGPAPEVLGVPCPACAGKLTHAVFGPTAVELCSACHGLFIDRGELEKTMQLVDTTAATTIVALARSVRTSGTIG
jgi:Zn-finger nucleic acid-binding protein